MILGPKKHVNCSLFCLLWCTEVANTFAWGQRVLYEQGKERRNDMAAHDPRVLATLERSELTRA
jgi:hypothetical protein